MSKSAVVKKSDSEVPAAASSLLAKAAEHAGMGVSQAAEDNLIPLVRILQSNSPQIDRRNPAYIEGAKPGDIMMRNTTTPIVDGDTGVRVVPVLWFKEWVEWVPREQGGGIAGRHPERPSNAFQKPHPENPDRMIWALPNGNELVETRNVVVMVNGVPFNIPMTGTNHTAAKAWETLKNQQRVPSGLDADGKPTGLTSVLAPAWAYSYRLKTLYRSRSGNNWYSWQADMPEWHNDEALFDAALALYESFSRGEKTVEIDEASVGKEADSEIPF